MALAVQAAGGDAAPQPCGVDEGMWVGCWLWVCSGLLFRRRLVGAGSEQLAVGDRSLPSPGALCYKDL